VTIYKLAAQDCIFQILRCCINNQLIVTTRRDIAHCNCIVVFADNLIPGHGDILQINLRIVGNSGQFKLCATLRNLRSFNDFVIVIISARIIAFAELEAFQNSPFRQLSSGMKSRLAFSIASFVRPDILILDEILAVGDGSFRTKSEAKMKEIICGGATTILVSHDLGQIRQMCSKILWLHKGQQVLFGSEVAEICDRYQAFLDGESL
jgi:energy-coupling factor transporter ATP-binding protein EcfA2